MNHQRISKKAQKVWSEIDKGFPGQRIKGSMITECFEIFGTMPRLGSSIYTKRLEEKCYLPKMPQPFDECRGYSVPKGVAFRTEITIKPNNPRQFLAAMFEGTGSAYEFKAYLLTNDAEYALTHPHITWEAQEEKR